MAVTRVGEIFNYLIVGDVDSRDYNVYITADAVFDAPERAVEAVSVPGRNGDILIDQGHWNNITVTYKCGIATEQQINFSEAISAYRNALASQIGYVRIEDSYNPDEYRLGTFNKGFSVATAGHNESGEFTVSFYCKPQRFLKSGETAASISSGDVLENPTLYPSSPLIKIGQGYGTIEFNGYEIEIDDTTYGELLLVNATNERKALQNDSVQTYSVIFNNDADKLNAGDAINLSSINGAGAFFELDVYFSQQVRISAEDLRNNLSITVGSTYSSFFAQTLSTQKLNIAVRFLTSAFEQWVYGTPWSKRVRLEGAVPVSKLVPPTPLGTLNVDIDLTLSYDGDKTVTLTREANAIDDGLSFVEYDSELTTCTCVLNEISGISTKTYANNVYIDTEIGEVYKIDGSDIIELNKYVTLGADLPKLVPEENEIVFDNTMSDVEIVPRWWKL